MPAVPQGLPGGEELRGLRGALRGDREGESDESVQKRLQALRRGKLAPGSQGHVLQGTRARTGVPVTFWIINYSRYYYS